MTTTLGIASKTSKLTDRGDHHDGPDLLTDVPDTFGVTASDGDAVRISRLLDGLAAADDGRFASWSRICAAAKAGDDPLLYVAFRDVVPSCSSYRPPGTLGEGRWHGDLVIYSGTGLADEEPCRSVGHWNPSTQAEVFQVLQGSVTMLVATGDQGTRACWRTTALRGDVVVMPPGCWHLTYSPNGPAAVFNLYTAPAPVSSDVDVSDKYMLRPPVSVWLTVTASDGSSGWSSDGYDAVIVAACPQLSFPGHGVWLDALLRHRDHASLDDLIAKTGGLSHSEAG